MSIEKLRSNIKINGILAIIGAALVVVSTVLGAAIAVMYGMHMHGGDPLQAGLSVGTNPLLLFVKTIISILGIATIVLGAMYISQGKKLNLKSTPGVLTIIAGAFSFLITFVSLVLWIIAAVQFFKIQIPDQAEQTNQAGPVDSSSFEG